MRLRLRAAAAASKKLSWEASPSLTSRHSHLPTLRLLKLLPEGVVRGPIAFVRFYVPSDMFRLCTVYITIMYHTIGYISAMFGLYSVFDFYNSLDISKTTR